MFRNPEDLYCFIVSTIAEPGSERRAKADSVKSLVDHAVTLLNERERTRLKKRRLITHRGEESFLTGEILSSIVRDILDDELIVAILFEDNPNVYLELGIAQTLGRPVILLIEEGYKAPFDISMFRAYQYPASLYAGGSAPELADKLAHHFGQVLFDNSDGLACEVPFGLTDTMHPVARTYPYDRFLDIRYPAFTQMILNADREIWFAGTSLFELFNFEKRSFPAPDWPGGTRIPSEAPKWNMAELLKAMFWRGRSIRILYMDKKNPHLERMMGSTDDMGIRRLLRKTEYEIDEMDEVMNYWLDDLAKNARSPLAQPGGNVRVHKITNRTLTHRVTLTEKMGYATPIFYSRTDVNSGPCFRIMPRSRYEDYQRAVVAKDDRISLYEEVYNDLTLLAAESAYREVCADPAETG